MKLALIFSISRIQGSKGAGGDKVRKKWVNELRFLDFSPIAMLPHFVSGDNFFENFWLTVLSCDAFGFLKFLDLRLSLELRNYPRRAGGMYFYEKLDCLLLVFSSAYLILDFFRRKLDHHFSNKNFALYKMIRHIRNFFCYKSRDCYVISALIYGITATYA